MIGRSPTGRPPTPGAAAPSITETDAADVRSMMESHVLPAVDVTGKVIPGMIELGAGGS
ncbi:MULTISPECIES: hypothetical protein [unclassified Streptomyces]|uniref:hypothetical protein n=1 Tax=unclassified Streptomyces TaxID=2593676 RepID=UPI00225717B8|nr:MULTISPECIES: hypothetical protein [unclassified Streptomyces]MCX4647051.1 hypothetical protein [Streptomyces sp. NBC_01446]MCX5326922.1 hypothetical protein [Streptomyces sp. NBC_00120]